MDRFVTRTPTWKTLNYSSMAAQSLAQKGSLTKKTPGDNKKKPLQQKQLSEVAVQSYDFDKRSVDLLPSSHHHQANAENFNGNSNDSGLSSASSISPQQLDENAAGFNVSPYKNHLGKLADYIDCPPEKENDTYMTITHSPRSNNKNLQVQKTLENKNTLPSQVQGRAERPLLPASSMLMERIIKDLNSPSAAARIKALKAMRSPTKSSYTHFDIPEAEQSFHLPEPPSLQEVMRNIVVYVEVRSGEDNRSAGVRKVIEALGARVTLSLNRETTHVVFKDGLMSTFKKAKQMNIPIVSILWIEACKTQRRICDSKDFPISNLDRYENPELYSKMKRVKSMQPDSECNKRIRAKAGGTPKDSTPTQKTGILKKTSTLIGGTPTSSTNHKKTDISQFFYKLDKQTPKPDSPATLLLNRIHNNSYTPLDELKTKAKGNNNNNNCAKKVLDFLEDNEDEKSLTTNQRRNSMLVKQKAVVEIEASIKATFSPIKKGRTRRHSLMAGCEIEATTSTLSAMAISVTPKPNTRRRSSVHTPKDMSMAVETPRNLKNIETIQEETMEVDNNRDNQPKSVTKRRTLYSAQTMEQTNLQNLENTKDLETPNKRSGRRRTLYASKEMETSEIIEAVNKVHSNVTTRRRTCFNFNSLEQSHTSESTDSETVIASAVNSKTQDSTNETELKTLPTPKATKPTNRRKTLYGKQKTQETNQNALPLFSPNVTSGSSISLTPTNFQKGKMACSTLLEDSDNRSNLVVTPTADATTGKLLEESEQYNTPLTFSSTRQPSNRRRTLFDVSMDIITQRVQCINQSARRSMAAATPSIDFEKTVVKSPVDLKKSSGLITPQTSSETLYASTNSNDDDCATETSKANILKKKRKLFMPNEMLATPPPAPPSTTPVSTESEKSASSLNNNAPCDSVTKRRRTLMPISQPQPSIVAIKESNTSMASTSSVKKRRSTLDFEQVQIIKTKNQSTAKDSELTSSDKSDTQKRTKAKRASVLVYTNMHQQQIDVIREAVDKLGVFTIEKNVTDTTTHLVSLEPRRTINLLKALARGLWILEYSWISESVKASKWLPEEPYLLQNFSRGIEICHSERQAFGNKYKCDLFHNFGSFYISSRCYPINKETMRELITLCGGRVVKARQKARYIIGDPNTNLEGKICLTPFWVLDSITNMQLMTVRKYLYPQAKVVPETKQLMPLEKNNE